MPVKKSILTGCFLIGACFYAPAPVSAAPHAASHGHRAPKSANQQALEKAQRARKALLSRRAGEAALIATQRAAQAKATQEAALQAARAHHFSDLTQDAAAELATTEKQIEDLTQEIARLTAQQEQQREALARRRASFQAILPVTLRLARYPSSSLLALSGQADDAVQGLSLIAGLTKLTERQSADLRGQQVLLDRTAQELAERNTALENARRNAERLHSLNARKMDVASHHQEEAQTRAQQARDEIAAATAKAATLDDALAAIEQTQATIRTRMEDEAKNLARQNRKAKARAVASQAKHLTSSGGAGVSHGGGQGPVSGTILTAWHQDTESGPATGITYSARPASPVTAPCAGQIDFAGPFRSFGNMVILDCGRHYRFVLSGLGQLSVASGQSVKRNAPMGQMEASGGRLFVQLRAGSKIVDPRPYL